MVDPIVGLHSSLDGVGAGPTHAATHGAVQRPSSGPLGSKPKGGC